MKPRIFIGSSAEGLDLANAIHANLTRVAHPKPWTQGVFRLSQATTTSLMNEVRNSDFGIFIFTPDDVAQIHGNLLTVARDNVVFELGLFSGALGTDRCFFLVPMGSDIHLPSDLLGLVPGEYDASRPAGEWQATVGPFCTFVANIIQQKTFRTLSSQEKAVALATRYETCEQIPDEPDRVQAKDAIFREMTATSQSGEISKWRLLAEQSFGYYVAFAAAVTARPEEGDADLMLSIKPSCVPRGNAQHKLLDAMLTLKARLNAAKKGRLAEWAAKFPNPDDGIPPRIEEFQR